MFVGYIYLMICSKKGALLCCGKILFLIKVPSDESNFQKINVQLKMKHNAALSKIVPPKK